MSMMKRFEKALEKNFMPFATKIASNKHIGAVRDGVILTMPLIIAGSIFLMIGHIPITGYSDFMAKI